MGGDVRPVPAVSDLTRPYWDAARERRLVVQRCADCGRYQHPPAPQCQGCRCENLEWAPIAGSGVVHEYTVVRMGRIAGFEDAPYICVTVELDEQPGLFGLGNLLDHPLPTPAESLVGLRVETVFEPIRDGVVLPQFRPAGGLG